MSERVSILKQIALCLMTHASHVLPTSRSEWGDAMRHELEHIESGWAALRWSAGCVMASYVERGHGRSHTLATVVRKPSAFLPVAMSLSALIMVLATISMFGVIHERDEGAVAHIWQLLMAGQIPILAFFAVRWLPRAPKQTLFVLALQTVAALAAMAPVYYLKL